MANRREFLQVGIAAARLPFVIPVLESLQARPVPPSPFYKVIVDGRFPAGLRFGTSTVQRGRSVHWIQGDITKLWFDDLDVRWKTAATALAGLTQESSLFCLELLARDRGMRLLHRTEHRADADGSLEPAADVLWNWRHDPAIALVGTVSPKLADDPQRLISWVIAPKETH